MRSILQREQWPIAVDVGTDTIRMIQLQRTGRGLSIGAYDEWRYPDSVREEPALRRAAAVKHVRQVLRSGGFSGREAVSSLSNESISIQNFRLAKSPEPGFSQAIRAKAAAMSDVPEAGSQFDYLVAGDVRGKSGKGREREIIALTASEQVVSDHIALLNDMGLKTTRIELDAIAMFHVFETMLRRQEDEGIVTVALDLGAQASRLIVASGGEIIFLKSIGIGGNDLTRAVAGHGNLDLSQASELRMSSAKEFAQLDLMTGGAGLDLSPSSESVFWALRDAVRGPVDRLAREIGLCLRYCAVTFRGIRSDKIHLCGGQANDGLVVRLLSEAMGMECSVMNPFSRFDRISVSVENMRDSTGPAWATVAGLAIGILETQRGGKEQKNDSRRLSA